MDKQTARRRVGEMNVSRAQSGFYAQTSMGFYLPITTDTTVAISSQFFLSKPLKFTPRRSLLPIMSVLCGVALFFTPPGTVDKQTTETQKNPAVQDRRCRRRRWMDGGAASLYR